MPPFQSLSIEEAFRYLEAGSHGGIRLGLDRMEAFLARLGSPEKRIPALHIAGTNGKGSTTAMVAACLASAGLKVGMFCSPYVDRFGERIRILSDPRQVESWWDQPDYGEIPDDRATELINRIRRVMHEGALPQDAHPTHFEMLTIMAFCYFVDEGCDVMVLETGLGGRLDSTNCIPSPVACAITAIGIDHGAILGDTLEAITQEKAGIIKPGSRCFLLDPASGDHSEADAATILEVIHAKCEAQGVELKLMKRSRVSDLGREGEMRSFMIDHKPPIYRTRLLPDYQQMNALLAIEVSRYYLQQQTALDANSIEAACVAGIAAAYVPARFEILQTSPMLIRDGGHNPQGTYVLTQTLQALYPRRKLHLIVAVMSDKDHRQMFRIMRDELSHRIVRIDAVTPGVPRAMEPREIQDELEMIWDPETDVVIRSDRPIEEALAGALDEAIQDDAMIICWGSFYQAGQTRAAWLKLLSCDD